MFVKVADFCYVFLDSYRDTDKINMVKKCISCFLLFLALVPNLLLSEIFKVKCATGFLRVFLLNESTILNSDMHILKCSNIERFYIFLVK